MKIAILTHFNSFQGGYAISLGWHERALMLSYFQQDYDFLVNTTCPEGLYPNQKNVLARLPDGAETWDFDKRAMFFRKNYREVLKEYDVILTADIMYQRKGQFLAWNKAVKDVDQDFKAQGLKKRWFHWQHSGWSAPRQLPYPESIRHEYMPGSTMVYMNHSEKEGVAEMYNTTMDNVACVYNPKDYRSFHNFDPLSWEITDILDIPNKDVVQIFPHCSTRMDAKGFMEVIQAHAALKKAGKSIALVMANSNARQVLDLITHKKEVMKDLGLVDREDFIFTHEITEKYAPLSRRCVADIFKISNVFVFGSWREVCPNVLLEAKISGNLLVVNDNLACGKEFGGEDAIYFSSSHKIPGVPDFISGESEGKINDRVKVAVSYEELAKKIIERLPSNDHLWEFSFERIWQTQMMPLLYGGDNA